MPNNMRGRLLAAGSTILVVAALLVYASISTASAATTTVLPTADAHVQADFPTTNYGGATALRIDGSPVANGYLKFGVSGLTDPVTKATLRLFVRATGSATAVTVSSVADTTWTESSITYDTAPAIGGQLGSFAPTAGTWATVDVTSAVKANGTYSFGLKTAATTSRSFDSKEGANPPQLVVETGTTTTPPTTTPPASTTTPPPPTGDPVVVVGGDVACSPTDANYNGGNGVPSYCHSQATSGLISQINPSNLLMVGDGQYNSGSLSDYQNSYGKTWGQHKAKTNPAVGNHDYGTSGAGGYYSYFGNAASRQQSGCVKDCLGYYSFDVGAWHLVNINSECSRLNGGAGCAVGSPQETWLKNDLAAHKNACTLVFDHRPRWSSNSFAWPDIAPLVSDMDAAHVDLLMSGHAHSYERFAPQNASGGSDPNGIRAFVVGTGGAFFTGFSTIAGNSVVHKSNIFGVLKLTLHSNSYDWSFVADSSTPYSDSGTNATCH
jgi:hypothetical protein